MSHDSMSQETEIPPSESTVDASYRQGVHARPFLITSIVVALFFGPLLVLSLIWPEQPWKLLLPFFVIVAIESALTSRWLNKPGRSLSAIKIHGAELIIFVVLLRFYTWLITSSFPDRSDFYEILRHPEAILDPFFVLASFLTLLILLRTSGLTDLFSRLSLDRSELARRKRSSRSDSLGDEYAPPLVDRQSLLQRYYREWAVGGAILILCAGISTFDLVQMESSDSGIHSLRSLSKIGLQPGMLIALLVYFLGGFLLASEGRLAMLSARWTYEGVEIEKRIFDSWRRYSLILLFLIAFSAMFIPISSTVDVSGVFQAIGWIALLLISLFVFVLSALYYLLSLGFLRPTSGEPISPLDLDDIVPDIPQLNSPPSNIIEILLGSAVWIIILAAIVLAVIYLVRNRDIRLRRGSFAHWWRRFKGWLRNQWRRLFKQIQLVGDEILSTLTAVNRPTVTTPFVWPLIRLRSLSPRDRIRYYYLSTVKRARDRGVERLEGETPSEYLSDLKENWPGVSKEAGELTEAFIKARYSGQSIAEADVETVKPYWKRLRDTIRR
jgi:hypothetical protein